MAFINGCYFFNIFIDTQDKQKKAFINGLLMVRVGRCPLFAIS